jgi:hypothetical protein
MTMSKLDPKAVKLILKDNHDLCVDRINRYFGPFETRTNKKTGDGWTGSFFEKYSERSDRECFDGNDVSAAISLSIRGEGYWVASLLNENENIDLSCFSKLPYKKCISDVPKDFFDKLGISQVIEQLLNISGIALVIASKLLASKRPHLFPIFDRDVSKFFGVPMPKNYIPNDKKCATYLAWCKSWQQVVSDPEVKTELENIRTNTSVKPNEQISSLRILDAIFWLDGKIKNANGEPEVLRTTL